MVSITNYLTGEELNTLIPSHSLSLSLSMAGYSGTGRVNGLVRVGLKSEKDWF